MNAVQRRIGGLGGVDVLMREVNTEPIEGFAGLWEPLYTFGSTGVMLNDLTSRFHGKVIGYRWHDPDPARKQGRVQWFGFPIYYFDDDGVQEAFNRTLDWFREETER